MIRSSSIEHDDVGKEEDKAVIEKLSRQVQMLKEQLQRKTNDNNHLMSSFEQIERHLNISQHQIMYKDAPLDHEPKLNDIEAKLIHTEEKLANYKYLFEKTRKQRDNLKLLIEEKNQQFQLCKENEEKYEEINRLSEQKIMQLKYSYESNQFQIQKIENQITRLLQERNQMLADKEALQSHTNEKISAKDKQIQELNNMVQNQKGNSQQLQQQIGHLKKKIELDFLNIEEEKKYLTTCLQFAQEKHSKDKNKLEAEIKDLQSRCERYMKELKQCKEDFGLQRQILRQKISEFTLLTETKTVLSLNQDVQKQELRRQLDLANQQLAINLRNNENEKRETRRYIEKLINDAQMQNSLYNQERRILKEEVQRARSEQYAINQEKIRKLREDILALRAENQRLTSIIDENEGSFHQLVNDHKEMHQGIISLQEHNGQLEKAVIQSQAEKNQLIHRLQQLEQKLADFEDKVILAMNQSQSKQEEQLRNSRNAIVRLQSVIAQLTQQKNYLTIRHSEQARELVYMQQEIIKLETQVNNYRLSERQSEMIRNSDYTKYLQSKIETYETQKAKATSKQLQLMKRIQNLVSTTNRLEMQKQQQAALKRDREMSLNLANSKLEKELIRMNQRIGQFQVLVFSKNQQITTLKEQSSSNNSSTLQTKIIQLETHNHKIVLQNYRLKSLAEEYNRSRMLFQQKNQQNKKLILQNRRLVNKILMIEESAKQLKQSYLQSQSQLHILENQLQESRFKLTLSSHAESAYDGRVGSNMKDELGWYQAQLKEKEDIINQCRLNEMQLQTTLRRYQDTIEQLSSKQEQFYRESLALQNAKKTVRILQEQLSHQRSAKRLLQQNYRNHLKDKEQQLMQVKRINEQFYYQNSALTEKVSSSSKYENQFLLEIAKQLDENYEIEGEEEQIQIRILQKISTQISELVDLNNKLKLKFSSHVYSEGQSINVVASIKQMLRDFITYLCNHQLINPEQVPSIPNENNPEKLVTALGHILKELFSNSIRSNEDQIIRYNHMIQEIRTSINEFYSNSNLESLNKLRNLIGSN